MIITLKNTVVVLHAGNNTGVPAISLPKGTKIEAQQIYRIPNIMDLKYQVHFSLMGLGVCIHLEPSSMSVDFNSVLGVEKPKRVKVQSRQIEERRKIEVNQK